MNELKKLAPMRVYAINQFKGVLNMLSKEGLKDLLSKTYSVPVIGLVLSRQELIDKILIQEYGTEDMEAFNADNS